MGLHRPGPAVDDGSVAGGANLEVVVAGDDPVADADFDNVAADLQRTGLTSEEQRALDDGVERGDHVVAANSDGNVNSRRDALDRGCGDSSDRGGQALLVLPLRQAAGAADAAVRGVVVERRRFAAS